MKIKKIGKTKSEHTAKIKRAFAEYLCNVAKIQVEEVEEVEFEIMNKDDWELEIEATIYMGIGTYEFSGNYYIEDEAIDGDIWR